MHQEGKACVPAALSLWAGAIICHQIVLLKSTFLLSVCSEQHFIFGKFAEVRSFGIDLNSSGAWLSPGQFSGPPELISCRYLHADDVFNQPIEVKVCSKYPWFIAQRCQPLLGHPSAACVKSPGVLGFFSFRG